MDNREALIAKLKSMGVKDGGQMMTNTTVSARGNNGPNMSAAQKLAAIKSGAAREKMSELIQAEHIDGAPEIAGGLGAARSFAPIPMPKSKRGEKVKPEYKQTVQSFAKPAATGDAGALDMIGNMFEERPSNSSMQSFVSPQQKPGAAPALDMDSVLNRVPTFNPEVARAKMKQKMTSNPMLQYAQEPTIEQQYQEQYMQQQQAQHQKYLHNGPYQQQNVMGSGQIDVNMLMTMMESIAKGVAEQAMRSVLDSYMENKKPAAPATDKNKFLFEYRGKEKGTNTIIVKDEGGQLYRLIPVVQKQG